jgi:hypothetical protein
MMFQCFLNYYTRWVSIRPLLRSKLIFIRNILQMSSKAKVNTSISMQVIFRPCLNESKKIPIHIFYLCSLNSKSHYLLNCSLYSLFFWEKTCFYLKNKKMFKTWKRRHMLRMFLITPKWCLDVDLDVLPYQILKTLAHFPWNPSNNIRGSSLLWRPFHKIVHRPCS